MTILQLFKHTGEFAENKDVAASLRDDIIMPAIKNNDEIVLDFDRVEGATQSFVHALISDAIRKNGSEVLDRIIFKKCNMTIQKIVSIVVDYMQQAE